MTSKQVSKKVYGTSLSGCLKDLVNGSVNVEDVVRIFTKTAILEKNWEEAIRRYGSLVFPNDKKKAEELGDILDGLIEDGIIVQERLSPRKRRPSSKNPLWVSADVDIETGIIWIACDKNGDLPKQEKKPENKGGEEVYELES